jgi:methionyl-tRNA synthetase
MKGHALGNTISKFFLHWLMSGEHVLICVAWPYANGPLHLGHVAGCYLPPDIQFRYERARGNRVLLVSGSDEHGTPITVSAEQQGISPQQVVDKFHAINSQALLDLGCMWQPNADARGIGYGGALFNRTSDERHKEIVQDNFLSLMDAGLFEKKTMQQYYEIREDGGRFLPDRYVEGECPNCSEDGARGDQCDSCGATYEAHELEKPRSKMNPGAKIEIRDTEHLFYRLDRFQTCLEEHAEARQGVWKANVKAMTKQWLEMGLRPRAITRDLEWGIEIPLEGSEWEGKCVYVWFEAVQGYLTCAKIWSERFGESEDDWKKWWIISEDGTKPRHLYFLGKDNIPFHTVIWPSLIMGLNHAKNGLGRDEDITLPGPGDLHLEDNVPAMEYLMLAGGQFSKSRKHAVWLPSFLERFDGDTLRYYLGINMPENHDTDFNWPDFVAKINSELIGHYGNFVHRVITLAHRLEGDGNPLAQFDNGSFCKEWIGKVESLLLDVEESLNKHRYKEALRGVMSIAQFGNQLLQGSTPWKYLKPESHSQEGAAESLAALAFSWRISRLLAIVTQPFIPFSAQRLWQSLGESQEVSQVLWSDATDWDAEMNWTEEKPIPLFKRLDLEEILEHENSLAEEQSDVKDINSIHGVKGSKKKEVEKMNEAPEGTTYLDFNTFMEVELRVGTISAVDEHPNADKLYVVSIDDGSESGRTVCAGLKEYYSPEQMTGKQVVFVANLQPRKLRGVMSEGMMLAADDGQGGVNLVSIDGSVANGSRVR